MMQEISLNILDIAQNSISAEAKNITIIIDEDLAADTMTVEINDDGKGMNEEFLKQVTSPFKTTRTTRKVGLGISFLKEAAELTGGTFTITSKVGVGTNVKAVFVHSNIDRQPLGDLAGTIASLIFLNPDIDFYLLHKVNQNSYELSTKEMRKMLDGVSLGTPEVMIFITDFINENM